MALERANLAAIQVGTKLRDLRTARGWTQQQLAVYAGVAGNTVVRAETGNSIPRVEQLMKLAFVLDVPVAELLPADIEPNAKGPTPKDRPTMRKRTTGSKGQISYSSAPSRSRRSAA